MKGKNKSAVIRKYSLLILLVGITGIACGQGQTMIQLKALDDQLQPYPRLRISINQGNPTKLDAQGVAFVELDNEELPPKSITVGDKKLEVESWNFSKGVLEIVIRPKTYKRITVIVQDTHNEPLSGIKIIFQAEEPITGISNGQGIITMSIPVQEDLNRTDKFTVIDYQLIEKKFKKNNGYIKINPIPKKTKSKTITSVSTIKKQTSKLKVINDVQEFNFKYLDSIKSLTMFFAVIRSINTEHFDEEMARRIDSKFYDLIGRWEDSLKSQRYENFLGKISDSSLVAHDVSMLIDQARIEGQMLASIREDFDNSAEVINKKLTNGGAHLSELEIKELLDGITLLSQILDENEQQFYQNQAQFKSLLNSFSGGLVSISELEEKLSLSEDKREEQSKDFNRKLLTAVGVSLILAIFGGISFVLTKKFKRQKNELAKANSQVKMVNEQLEELVSKRTAQLQDTNKELDTFLYKSSHDLRRPLTTILGLGNIARLTLSKESNELFEKATNTANQMDRMLQKLINVNDIHHPNDYRSIDFEKQVQNSIDEFQELIITNSISLESTVQESILFKSYPDLIEIIIRNLVENALMFSSIEEKNRKPRVELTVAQQNGHISITLKDNGPGVDSTIKDKIWDMFFVGHEKSNGNGLGLYLTYKAVKVLKGTVKLQSDKTDLTSFVVQLPVNGKP